MAARTVEFDPAAWLPGEKLHVHAQYQARLGSAGVDIGCDVIGLVDCPAHVGDLPAPDQVRAAAQVEKVDLGVVVDRGLEEETPQVDGGVILHDQGRGDGNVEPGAGAGALFHRGADVALVFHPPGQFRRLEDGRHAVGPEIKSLCHDASP